LTQYTYERIYVRTCKQLLNYFNSFNRVRLQLGLLLISTASASKQLGPVDSNITKTLDIYTGMTIVRIRLSCQHNCALLKVLRWKNLSTPLMI